MFVITENIKKCPVFMDVKSRGGFGLMHFVQCQSRNPCGTWEDVLVRNM